MAQPTTQLNATEQDTLVKQIGLALLRAAPRDWRRITAQYRAVGRYHEMAGEVLAEDGSVTEWMATHDIATLFGRLRAGMYRESRGTWFNARYQLDHPSSYNLEYDRDEPRWDLQPPPQAYADELRMFPRTEDNVPEWLMRRMSGLSPEQPGPRFRIARIFDGQGPDGRPVINRPEVDEDERERLQTYLDAAPVVLSERGLDLDRLAAPPTPKVPVAYHTDGTWIWPAATSYYLNEHGVSPEADLVAHVRSAGFTLGEVPDQAVQAANAYLTRGNQGPQSPLPPRSPRPAADAAPAVPEDEAGPDGTSDATRPAFDTRDRRWSFGGPETAAAAGIAGAANAPRSAFNPPGAAYDDEAPTDPGRGDYGHEPAPSEEADHPEASRSDYGRELDRPDSTRAGSDRMPSFAAREGDRPPFGPPTGSRSESGQPDAALTDPPRSAFAEPGPGERGRGEPGRRGYDQPDAPQFGRERGQSGPDRGLFGQPESGSPESDYDRDEGGHHRDTDREQAAGDQAPGSQAGEREYGWQPKSQSREDDRSAEPAGGRPADTARHQATDPAEGDHTHGDEPPAHPEVDPPTTFTPAIDLDAGPSTEVQPAITDEPEPESPESGESSAPFGTDPTATQFVAPASQPRPEPSSRSLPDAAAPPRSDAPPGGRSDAAVGGRSDAAVGGRSDAASMGRSDAASIGRSDAGPQSRADAAAQSRFDAPSPRPDATSPAWSEGTPPGPGAAAHRPDAPARGATMPFDATPFDATAPDPDEPGAQRRDPNEAAQRPNQFGSEGQRPGPFSGQRPDQFGGGAQRPGPFGGQRPGPFEDGPQRPDADPLRSEGTPRRPGPFDDGPQRSGPLENGPQRSGPFEDGPQRSGPLEESRRSEPVEGRQRPDAAGPFGAPRTDAAAPGAGEQPEPGAFGVEAARSGNRTDGNAFDSEGSGQGGFGSEAGRAAAGGFAAAAGFASAGRPEAGGFGAEGKPPEPGGFGPESGRDETARFGGGSGRPEAARFGSEGDQAEGGGFGSEGSRAEATGFGGEGGRRATGAGHSEREARPEPGPFGSESRPEPGPFGSESRPEPGPFRAGARPEPGRVDQRADVGLPGAGRGETGRSDQYRAEGGLSEPGRADQYRGEAGVTEPGGPDTTFVAGRSEGGFVAGRSEGGLDAGRSEGGFETGRGEGRPEPGRGAAVRGEPVVESLRTRLRDLGVPASAYRIGEPAEHAWSMEHTDAGWRVGWYDDKLTNPAVFGDPEDAAAFMLGKLLLDPGGREASPSSVSVPIPNAISTGGPGSAAPLNGRAEEPPPIQPPVSEQQPALDAPPTMVAPPVPPPLPMRRELPKRGEPARPAPAPAAPNGSSQWPILPLPGEPPLTLFRGKEMRELPAGSELDRFGAPNGNLTYAAGTPFEERSLVPEWVSRPYHVYRVQRPIEALAGVAIPWFNQPGGGAAYLLSASIDELVAEGDLVELDPDEPPID